MPWIQSQIYDGFTENMSKDDKARSDDLTVNVWPTTIDCIDWSKDAEIVIAAGDDVQLLIPKLKIVEDAPDAVWEFLRLRVTAFSPEEAAQEEPISSRSASLGEEVSSAEVVSAKWTPPGIAKHGRCALLIHTQNLLLSIWAPKVQPRSHQDWRRRVIVNHELQRYFEELHPQEKQKPNEPRNERLRELIRVRAFAISHSMKSAVKSQAMRAFGNDSYIAISNDNNEVVILRCFGSSSEDTEIRLEAKTHFSTTDESPAAPNLSWSFEDYMDNSRFVQHLAWSPWFLDKDGSLRSLLACATQSIVLLKWVVLSICEDEPEILVEDFEGSVRLKKPWTSDASLGWLPDIYDSKFAKLIACTADKVMMFSIDLLGDDKLRHWKYERCEWGQIAGKLHLKNGNVSEESIQVLPHMTVSHDFLSELSLNDLKPTENRHEGLLEAVKYNRSLFDAKFDWAHGNILAKLWGLSGSPLHDLAVAVSTFHPSNSPEYIIPADMSSRVVFQHTGRDDFITQAINQGASTEAIAFSTKWLVKDMKTQPEKNKSIWALLDQIDRVMKDVKMTDPIPDSASFEDLLYNSVVLTRLRYERVLSVMIGHSEAAEEMEKQVVEQIAIRILQVPASRYQNTASSRLMLANMRKALVKLGLSAEAEQEMYSENCDICNADVAFEELGFAQCRMGHKFRRCALTFLAIQAPSISKSCGICGKQYLKTSHVESQNSSIVANEDVEMVGTGGSSSDPLTELLSAACNRCIYCGGKFIG